MDESVARDIVLVIDRSGSMEGEKMAQAIGAAEYVLDHLGANDRFAVIDFSRYVHAFDEGLRPAADAAAGIEYVRGLSSGGNTNISGALERGMAYLDGERPGTVIFLTDGLPTVGLERAEDILAVTEDAAPERTQLFAFGVGYDVDTDPARRAGPVLRGQQPPTSRRRSASTAPWPGSTSRSPPRSSPT